MQMKVWFGAAALLMLAACGETEAFSGEGVVEADRTVGEGSVAARPGYIRPAPEGAVSTAGYFEVIATADDTLLAASAPGFGVVEIHRVTDEGGVSRMRRVEDVALEAGEVVAFEPGGYHLMMMQPETALADGDTVPVTLTFEGGTTLTVPLPVSATAARTTGHEGHGS